MVKPQIPESDELVKKVKASCDLLAVVFNKNDYFTDGFVDWDKVRKLTKQKRAILMLSINGLPKSADNERAMDIMDKTTIRQTNREEQN